MHDFLYWICLSLLLTIRKDLGKTWLDTMSSLKYTTQAASYDHGSESQRAVGSDLIKKLKIPKGSFILDLGCGTGSITKLLSEQVGPKGKIIAVDPDEERLKFAKENYSTSNIEFVSADDRTFPIGQYDLVFCNAVIHWIKDKQELHKRVYQCLRPGGRFAYTTPAGFFLSIPDIGQRIFRELVSPDFIQWMLTEVLSFTTTEKSRSLAAATGFELVSLTVEESDLKWESLDHYIDSMYGWFGGRFDPSEFDKDVFGRLKEEYGDGPVVCEPLKKLEVILTKPKRM